MYMYYVLWYILTSLFLSILSPSLSPSLLPPLPLPPSFLHFLSFRAELQVATTQDYATDSWFWTVFTGALNHQTTHHLFPGVIQSHYRLITPIIKKTCEEFGIKYHYVDTTQEALGCHLEHLRRLGQEEVDKDK